MFKKFYWRSYAKQQDSKDFSQFMDQFKVKIDVVKIIKDIDRFNKMITIHEEALNHLTILAQF